MNRSAQQKRGTDEAKASEESRSPKQRKTTNMEDAGADETSKQGDTTARQALSRAQAFIKALMGTEKQTLDGSPDVRYFENIPMLMSGQKKTIVLTEEVEQFWQACFEKSKTRRVCGVGSPGAGKSTTMIFLIRILLENKKKVVYLNKTVEKGSYYYVWEVGAEHGQYKTTIYKEKTPIEEVINLENGDKVDDTYYLCDPGKTLESCDPSPDLEASVVINASGDDRHWGGREFTKRKEDDGLQFGTKLTFPLPKKRQLLAACKLFAKSATQPQVEERHRMFGCIPRNVFAEQDEADDALTLQKTDLALMTTDMTRRIVNNTAELNNNGRECPRATIMGITSDPPTFRDQKAIFISDLVMEEVAKKHIKDIWNEVAAENSPNRGLLFEAYVRSLLTDEVQRVRVRNACGKSSKG